MSAFSRSLRRCAALVLVAALAACSTTPRPRSRPPTSLAEINRALSWHYADVALANEVVMRGLRGVEITPERLSWINDSGQRREMPIAEVVTIVLRGRDPDATPPTEGGKLLAGPSPFPAEPEVGTPMSGSFDGDAAVVAGAVYGALYLASATTEDPGVLIYEAPVTRYLAAPPGTDLTEGEPPEAAAPPRPRAHASP